MMKVYRFIYGLFLTLFYVRIFPLSYLKGKRIAVVGPASSAFNTNKGEFIDSFDVIVRVNKSARLVHQGKHRQDIGTRTDILFHSFFENEESGGGPLDVSMFARQGVCYLINPRNTFKGLRNSLNFYKKYLIRKVTYTLPWGAYEGICRPLKPFRPTVGFAALSFLISKSEFKELYITGFTFYRTPFGAGYRDQIQDPGKAKAYILEQGHHNIDFEYEAFRTLMKLSNKNIVLEDTLSAILAESESVS